MLEAAQILLKSAHREPRPNFEPRILLQKGRNMQHMFQNMGGGGSKPEQRFKTTRWKRMWQHL